MTNVIELAKQLEIWPEPGKRIPPAQVFRRNLDQFAKLVRNAALEQAKQIVAPKLPRPCDCEICDCGNRDDAQRVAEWDSENSAASAIEALKEPTP